MELSQDTLVSNEQSGTALPTELLRATKKVKNKEADPVEGNDLVMQEIEISKTSFKDMLMGNKKTETENDAHLPLDDEEEIVLHEDDVQVSLDGPYPHVCFSKRVHSRVDENNKQSVIVRMLGRPIGYKALSNRLESL